MSNQGLKLFLELLSSICLSLPARSVCTFIELIVGAILSPAGHVTSAFVAGNFSCHWTSYYKWISKGSWDLQLVLSKYMSVVTNFLYRNGERTLRVSVDDTIVYRSSKKAPCAKYDYEHSSKPNRSKYVWGQTWVSAAITVFNSDKKPLALPAISEIAKKKGNKTKIHIALDLIESVSHSISEQWNKIVLADAWFMKATFIKPAIELGFTVIGQVRIDTALFLSPVEKKKGRGRKRIYGEQVTLEKAMRLKKIKAKMHIFGKENEVRYSSKVVKVRFLKARKCVAIWCEIYDAKKNKWSKPCLILCTNLSLHPEEIIKEYSYRWPIESFFNQIKNDWGMKNAWQRSEEGLKRWFHINCIGYGLMALVNCYAKIDEKSIFQLFPWRKKIVTVGLLINSMKINLSILPLRELWSFNYKKIIIPNSVKIAKHKRMSA